MNSDTSSDQSVSPSPSPPHSPSASVHALPSTERVLQFFVAAKRALNSTTFVWRANELVTSSRALVEELAILQARNAFSERAVGEQVETLYAIRDSVASAGTGTGDEFKGTIQKLDLANDRLERTLDELRKTVLDVSLQRQANAVSNGIDSSQGGDAASERNDKRAEQTLYDFINESSHVTLQASLRASIDSFHDSRADLDSSASTFESILRTVTKTLPDKTSNSDPADISTIHDEPRQAISEVFRSVEEHAAEMAKLLESLVSHYDLCVSALKHTEGGGEAAKRAVQQAEIPLTQHPPSGVEESLYLKDGADPISAEERSEMLHVLANDASEVEDVVTEIRDRNNEQESRYEQLLREVKKARARDDAIHQGLEMLHEVENVHLPSHVHALNTFKASWQRIQTSIATQTAELVSLKSFYDSFLSGYSRLLREVDRREAAESQMRKIAEKAKRDLEKLYDLNKGLRAEFMEETGRFLPQGIWAGSLNEGIRWEVLEIGSGTE